MRTCIYLDFDGVVSPMVPGVQHGHLVAVEGDCVPASILDDFKSIIRYPRIEIIWATHREDAVYDVTDQLGFPRFPHLTFTDPTGSKVKEILTHYTANPCDYAVVFEDSLTTAEIKALTAAGLIVELFDNGIHQSTHHPEDK